MRRSHKRPATPLPTRCTAPIPSNPRQGQPATGRQSFAATQRNGKIATRHDLRTAQPMPQGSRLGPRCAQGPDVKAQTRPSGKSPPPARPWAGAFLEGAATAKGRESSSAKKGIDNNQKLCYTTDVPTGSSTVKAVMLSVKRASPQGLALFLYCSLLAQGAKCAPDSNTHAAESLSQDGGGPLRGPPPPPHPQGPRAADSTHAPGKRPAAFPYGRYRVAPYIPAALHFSRLGCGQARSTGQPLGLHLSVLRLPRTLRVGARGQKGPRMMVGLFGPSARPRPAGRGRRSSPGPLPLARPSRGPGWPPACAAAHSGLRGASAAALAFLKPRAPASRASPFLPFGVLPARGVSACARGGSTPLPCWSFQRSTASRVYGRRLGAARRRPTPSGPRPALDFAVLSMCCPTGQKGVTNHVLRTHRRHRRRVS